MRKSATTQNSLGIGIIGAGSFGARHAEAIAALDGVQLVAAMRTNATALAEFTTRYGGRGYTDAAALLAVPGRAEPPAIPLAVDAAGATAKAQPPDPKSQLADLEKKIAELQKQLAEAQKQLDALKARLQA